MGWEVVKQRGEKGDKTLSNFKFLGFCKTDKLKKWKITRSNVVCGSFMKAPSLMHTLPRFPGGCHCDTVDVQGTHMLSSPTVNREADADLTEGLKY